jgi:hypothetical protein
VIAQLSLTGDDKLERPTRELNALLRSVAGRVFPDVPGPELARALRLALITLIQMLAHPTGRADEGDLRPYVDVVVDFVTGGLVAASTGLPVEV